MICAVLAQSTERVGPNDEDAGSTPADGSSLLLLRVKLKRIERWRPKPKVVGSNPITRPNYVMKGRVSSTEERLSYKQATRVRLLHPAPNFSIQG
jgi:hypothetical protein